MKWNNLPIVKNSFTKEDEKIRLNQKNIHNFWRQVYQICFSFIILQCELFFIENISNSSIKSVRNVYFLCVPFKLHRKKQNISNLIMENRAILHSNKFADNKLVKIISNPPHIAIIITKRKTNEITIYDQRKQSY